MDTDKMSVNCKNGIIDLRTGKLMPHDINKFMTKIEKYPMELGPLQKKEIIFKKDFFLTLSLFLHL